MEKIGASFQPPMVERLSTAEIEDLMQDDLMARVIFRSLLLQKGVEANKPDRHGRGSSQAAGDCAKG
jgi:hypothetical protein